LSAAARIRAYLDALPDSVNIGAQFAYGKQFRSADWSHDSYPLTRDDLEDVLADAAAFRDQPALRHCLFPGCLAEFDVAARLAGMEPARPSWSGEGWVQMRPTILTGYACPAHAQAICEHRITWQHGSEDTRSLACSCGWASPTARWRGVPEASWQDHLLITADA
jgi:hypothetical protein